MKINYKKYGDYYLPMLSLAEKKTKTLNKYGLLRLDYLKHYNKVLYQQLVINNKLNEHLFSVSIEAENKVNNLIKELIDKDDTINEHLKATNQLLWIQKMNSLKQIAEEIVLKEYIYGEEN